MTEIAIIGAGPYGLSIAAHLRGSGVPFRIFGRPMDSWVSHMPEGMHLKSDGFASNLSDPDGSFTLKHFCAERGIKYSDSGIPVSLETFSAYGLAFKERMVPELEDKLVVHLEQVKDGFLLRLDTNEAVFARRVVLAVGITHFEYVPPNVQQLPPEFRSHSFCHRELERFRGRDVVVVGGGSSATDLAGLLYDADARVQLVARRPNLKFHNQPTNKPRSAWKQIRHPQSGLGPGLRSRLYADAPNLFHHLPEALRLKIVRKHLGPSGAWFIKEKVVGNVPLLLGQAIEHAEVKNGRVELRLRGADGAQREITTDHVIAATGYRVSMSLLPFLTDEIRSTIMTVDRAPKLSSTFESSVPGLYFVGLSAANSFGPLMRFAFGAAFTARSLTHTMAKLAHKNRAAVSVPCSVPVTK
jgi:thioredoxin reductase